MPRANRYIVPGFAYHLTHRCHNRNFLLKFALDRQRYRIRLREALLDSSVDLLTYNITRNHVHPLGSKPLVEVMERRVRHRQHLGMEADDGMWLLREEHGSVFEPEK